jgi:hypothetical protein
MKEMLCEARKAKKAVGSFNITNYETAAAVLKAAEDLGYTEEEYDVTFVFVAYGADGLYDYAITFTK